MKTFKILFAAVIIAGFATSAIADDPQYSDQSNVTASAVVVTDISIENVRNVQFGVVARGNEAKLGATDNVATNAGLGDSGYQLGRIHVSSSEHVAFRFDFDASVVLSNQNGEATMTFEPSVTHTSDEGAEFGSSETDLGNVISAGNDFFFIGGTMDVADGQETGNYEGTFQVSVEYL